MVQEEKVTKNEPAKVRGNVKVARLVGDSDCPDLLAVSIYGTKPVHFLSTWAETIKWREKKQEVYDRQQQQMHVMLFLCPNVNDDYNYGMGGADIADQLQGSYRFDKWMRNYKWWHVIYGGVSKSS